MQKATFSASVQAKKGRLYAVIQTKENGKSKPVWRALGLPEDTPKTKVNKMFREVVNRFEEEYTLNLERGGSGDADVPVAEYLKGWLEKIRTTIQLYTYSSYHSMIYGKIDRYFSRRPSVTVGSITPADIQAFYDTLFADGLKGNTVIHYHAILRRAFQQAFKNGLIEANPFDRVERPKKGRFVGEHYSEEELLTLLSLTENDVIYPAIILAGGLGLRRSEALGMRWSRINWEESTVLLDTKIVETRENGTRKVIPVEEMKNKTSRRTLPLPQPVLEMLKCQKAKQEMYRRMFRSSYCREYEDYVCVNQLGELLAPSYVTSRFADLLTRYSLRKIRFHDLRHTFASILLSKDVPLINVSKFLGHSDVGTTSNIYGHLDKASKEESAKVMGDILQGKAVRKKGGSADE